MPTVYVVQRPPVRKSYDLANALDFGSIDYLLDSYVDVRSPQSMIEQLDAALARFDVDDFLILIGHPLVVAAAVTLVSDITGGVLQVLNWNGMDRKYQPIKMDFGA